MLYCFISPIVIRGAGMIGGGDVMICSGMVGVVIMLSKRLTMACSVSNSSEGRNVSVVDICSGSSTTVNGAVVVVVVVSVFVLFEDGCPSSCFLLLLIFFFSFSTGGILFTMFWIAERGLFSLMSRNQENELMSVIDLYS